MNTIVIIIVATIGTFLGSLCGIGGGIIIKPILDAFDYFTHFQVGLISMSCVLTTSLSAVIKHLLNKTHIKFKDSITLAIGSILGGIAGAFLLNIVKESIINAFHTDPESAPTEHGKGSIIITIIQNALIMFFMMLVLLYMLVLKKKGISFHLENIFIICAIGLFLGLISVFMDIGGGAINVCIFVLLFSMDVKSVAVDSLLVIVFSQTAKFVQYAVIGNFQKYVVFNDKLPWWLFVVLIVISVITGIYGSVLNRKIKANYIDYAYNLSIFAIILIAGFNVIAGSIKLGDFSEA